MIFSTLKRAGRRGEHRWLTVFSKYQTQAAEAIRFYKEIIFNVVKS